MEIKRNSKIKTLELLYKLDGKKVHFERNLIGNIKKFLNLPYYELITIFDNNGDIEDAYLTKVYPKTKETYIF